MEKYPFEKQAYKWIMFVIIFAFSILYSIVAGIDRYTCDSEYYWEIARTVFEDGFDIMAFPETFRGYFFAVFVYALKTIFNGVWGWRLFSAFAVALCFSFILPYLLIGHIPNNLKEIVRGITAYAIYMWIWGDLMQYPLSDFAAVFFAISGAAVLKSIELNGNIYKSMIKGVLAGALLYAAYNTRAAYMYGAILFIVLFIAFNHKIIISKSFIVLVAIIIGAIIVACPQCMINKKYIGIFSPKVYTEALFGYSQDLQAFHLYLGTYYYRYETYIGNQEYYPSDRVYFDDPVGAELMQRYELSGSDFGLKSILDLFIKNPMDVVGMYMRHLISLLTPAYKQVYITDLYTDKGFLATFSILIWIIAGVGILESFSKKSWSKALWILAICLPSFLQLFGEPELRFFLAVYLLCYYYVFACIDYKKLLLETRGRRIKIGVGIGIVFLLWITVYGDSLADNKERTLLINDSKEYIEQTANSGEQDN